METGEKVKSWPDNCFLDLFHFSPQNWNRNCGRKCSAYIVNAQFQAITDKITQERSFGSLNFLYLKRAKTKRTKDQKKARN